MTRTAKELTSAILRVHHFDDMPPAEDIERIYRLLVVAINTDDGGALAIAQHHLRNCRDYWAGGKEPTVELADISPALSYVVYALDFAYLTATLGLHRTHSAPLPTLAPPRKRARK